MKVLFLSLALVSFFFVAGPVAAADIKKTGPNEIKSIGTERQPRVEKYSPSITIRSLKNYDPKDQVVFSDGKKMSVGALRSLAALQAKIIATKDGRAELRAVKIKPAATGRLIKDQSELAAALKLPPGETIQLRSGRTLTVAQLKYLQPLVEKRMARRFSDMPQRASMTGPVIKVTSATTKAEMQELLRKPDNTILESSTGVRATVGEIKQELAKRKGSQPPAQRKTGVSSPKLKKQ